MYMVKHIYLYILLQILYLAVTTPTVGGSSTLVPVASTGTFNLYHTNNLLVIHFR